MALNDEQYEVRMTTTVIIGRLAHHNPAHVMPSLRKTLVQLLTEMEYTKVPYVPWWPDPVIHLIDSSVQIAYMALSS